MPLKDLPAPWDSSQCGSDSDLSWALPGDLQEADPAPDPHYRKRSEETAGRSVLKPDIQAPEGVCACLLLLFSYFILGRPSKLTFYLQRLTVSASLFSEAEN